MREGWERTTIEHVAKVINGGTPKTRTPEYWGGSTLWITPAEMSNLSTPYLADSRRTLTEAGLKGSSATLVPPKSVILSTRAPIGHLIINTEPMAFNQGCRGIVPNHEMNYKYLYYFLLSSVSLLNNLGSGTTFKELAAGKLKKVEIPFPPLPEQKCIVAILDDAFASTDAAIANTEKNLANARELFESYLNGFFSQQNNQWAEVKVDSVCSSIIDCINKTAPQADSPTPFKMIRTTNVRNGLVNLLSVRYVKEETYKSWTRRQVPCRGDIILTREAPLGEVGLLDTDEKVFLGQRLVSYRANPEVLNNKFLLYIFQSEYVKSQIKKLASGSTVQHMRVPDSKNLRILLPSLDSQSRLVDYLDFVREQTRSLESIYQQKITALTELKQSLLHKAFSGELTADKASPGNTFKEEACV